MSALRRLYIRGFRALAAFACLVADRLAFAERLEPVAENV